MSFHPESGAATASLVGVVTPVYNTSRYLPECIRSVLGQSFRNFFYVVADNASTDGSAEVAAELAANDPRLKVHKFSRHLSQVANYNRAVDLLPASCRYVKIVEADNFLYPECLAEMVALADAHPSVRIVSSYSATESRTRFTGLPVGTQVLDGRTAARMHLKGDVYCFGAPTTVLMHGDFVRSRKALFDESCLIAEDLSACFDALLSGDFGFVHKVLTFVRTENDSTLSRIAGFDGQALDRLAMITRHGKAFFPEPEFEEVRKGLLALYYEALARGVVDRRPPQFWEFHRRGMEHIGIRLDKPRLALATGKEMLRRLLGHPRGRN